MATTHKIRNLKFHSKINVMNTKVSWIDHKRVLVETPSGDDFEVGFADDTNYQIEMQSVFKITHDLGLLFDKFYKGDDSAILGEINRQLMLGYRSPILFYQRFEKTRKNDERIRIGKRIKEIRIEKGLDAKTLATIAGIDASNLCRIEAGKYSVGFDILSKLAYACGKKVEFIDLGEEDHERILNTRL